MNITKTLGLLVLLVILLGGGYLLSRQTSLPEPEPATSVVEQSPPIEPQIVNIEVRAGSFYFLPGEITVTEGEKVRLTIVNDDGVHDWVLDEFNARTTIMQAGETATVEFTADKVGTFEYYCSVGNHRQMGMVGRFVVKSR